MLKELGSKHALVVHGTGGLDELSTIGPTKISELAGGKITAYYVKPEDYGFRAAKPEQIRGDDADSNARITREILAGSKGPKRDIVLLNAGAAIYVGGRAKTIKEGIKAAEKSIDSGKAMAALEKLVEVSNA